MLWKLSAAALALPLAWCAQPGLPAPALTLDDLIRAAAGQNRELQAVRLRAVEAQALLRQAAVRPAPTLDLSAAAGRPLGSAGESDYSATLSQPLETAGKRARRLDVAEAGLSIARAEFDAASLRLASDVKLRYFEFAAARARLAALDQLSLSLRSSLELIDARIRLGDAAPLDRQLLLVEIQRNDSRRAVFDGRLQSGLADLRRLCAIPAAQPLSPSDPPKPAPLPPGALASLQSRAASLRPDLQLALLEERRASAESALARALARPDLTLTASYSLRNESIGGLSGLTSSGALAPVRDRDNTVGVGISLPLSSRARNLGNIQAASARAAAARSLRLHLDASIPLQVQAAWLQYNAAAQSLDILSSGVLPQARRNLDIMRQAYSIGELRLLDILNEQRRLIDTQLEIIDAELDLRRALVDLELAVGGDIQ